MPSGVWGLIFKRAWIPYLLLALLAGAVYMRSVAFDYTYLDDTLLILDNEATLTPLTKALTSFAGYMHTEASPYYRPVMLSSFIIDHAFAGKSPGVYHFTSTMLHLIACLLLFTLLKRLGADKKWALLLAALFSVHPALSQNVYWVMGRADVVPAIFIMASFVSFLSYIRNGRKSSLLLHLVLLLLALLSKEISALTMIMAIVYMAVCVRCRFFPADLLLMYAGWGATFLAWLGLKSLSNVPTYGDPAVVLIGRMVMNAPSFLVYCGKLFFPFNLSPVPYIPDTTVLFGVVALTSIAVSLWVVRGANRSLVSFGTFWAVMFLVPSLIVSVGNEQLSTRLYIPAIGVLIASLGLPMLRGAGQKPRRAELVLIALIAAFSVMTFLRGGVYSSRLDFWKEVERTSPSYSPTYMHLGSVNQMNGNMAEAKRYYLLGLEKNPKQSNCMNNLAIIALGEGDAAGAERWLLSELAISPGDPYALNNIYLLYASSKEWEKAALYLRRLIDVRGRDPVLLGNLAVIEANLAGKKPASR